MASRLDGLPPLMDAQQLADLLGVGKHALFMQRTRNQRPGCLGFKIGKKVYWRRSDLETFLDEQVALEAATRRF